MRRKLWHIWAPAPISRRSSNVLDSVVCFVGLAPSGVGRAQVMNDKALRFKIRRHVVPWQIVLVAVILAAAVATTSVAQAQTRNGILEPAQDDLLTGIVVIRGTAVDPDFLRYEVAFLREGGSGDDWIVFAQGDQQVIDDTLAIWDTTVGVPANPVFPDGSYRLRLRVVRTDYNYDEFFVTGVFVANGTVTPTVTITGTVATGTPVRPRSTALAATLQSRPANLPTLTPFPTPSPQATPENATLGPADEDGRRASTEGGGLIGQLSSVDTGRFGRAFFLGVRLVAIAFAILAAYLLLRAIFRRLWRLLRSRRFRA